MVILKLVFVNGVWVNKEGQSMLCEEACPLKKYSGIVRIKEHPQGTLVHMNRFGSVQYHDGQKWRHLYPNMSRFLKSKFTFPIRLRMEQA